MFRLIIVVFTLVMLAVTIGAMLGYISVPIAVR